MSLKRAELGPVLVSTAPFSSRPNLQPAPSRRDNVDSQPRHPRASIQLALAHAREIASGRGLWSDTREAWGLTVRIEEQDGKAWLFLSGELDFLSQPLIEECLAIAQDDHDSVGVDLEGLAFMDSNGIDAFLHAALRAKERSGQFLVANPHKHRRLFLLTHTSALLELREASPHVTSPSSQAAGALPITAQRALG